MALLKSHHQSTSDSSQYVFDDYEQKKADYLKKIEEQGQGILQKAQDKARSVIADAYKSGIDKAVAEVAKQKEMAIEEGHKQGVAQAKEEVKKENEVYVQTNMLPVVEQLKVLAQKYENTIQTVTEKAGADIEKTAINLAKALLLVEPEYNQRVLEERINKAISYLKVDMELNIRVNPEDKAHAEKYFSSVLEKLGCEAKLVLKEDQDLSKGDIQVTSGDSQVQLYSLTQWESALRELKLEESD